MHLPAEEFFNSRGEISHARRAIRVSKCAQSRLYRNSERAQSRCKNVKCFARKTPQKQGFKTCKIEKINRLTGCKTGDWQGGKNVFLSKNIALATLYASFWRPICMPLTCKGIQIGVLKQCFYPKIRIKRIYKHAENSQITEYKNSYKHEPCLPYLRRPSPLFANKPRSERHVVKKNQHHISPLLSTWSILTIMA